MMAGGSELDAACTGWDNGECSGTPHCPPRCPRFFDREDAPILITPLEDDHVERLVAMYESFDATDRANNLPPRTRGRIRAWLDGLTDRGWNLVAWHDDRAVGHVGIAPATAVEPELLVFVADAYRGRGVGTELLKQLVAYTAVRGYDALELAVERNNERAISVYENLSFEVAEENLGTVAMELSLAEPIATDVQRPPAKR